MAATDIISYAVYPAINVTRFGDADEGRGTNIHRDAFFHGPEVPGEWVGASMSILTMLYFPANFHYRRCTLRGV